MKLKIHTLAVCSSCKKKKNHWLHDIFYGLFFPFQWMIAFIDLADTCSNILKHSYIWLMGLRSWNLFYFIFLKMDIPYALKKRNTNVQVIKASPLDVEKKQKTRRNNGSPPEPKTYYQIFIIYKIMILK